MITISKAKLKARMLEIFRHIEATGEEVIRWESSFRVFHTQGMFDYVSSGAFRDEPSLQRYLAARTEHIRASGRDINIWRYADEPITPPRP